MTLESWKTEFAGRKIAIWGYGIEGKASYRFIRKLLPDQSLTIIDGGKGKDVAEDETTNTTILDDKNVDFSKFDIVLKAPGIVVPEGQYLNNMTSETELFLKHYRNRTIGITGTKGKSTTTSLVARILSEQYQTVLVGNIGIACFDAIEQMEQGALAAFEISCHQLEYTRYSPHVGVYLNLYEEHLDHYGSLQKYGDAKFHNIAYMQEGDLAIMHEMLNQYGYIDKAPVKPLLIGKDIYAKDHVLYSGTHHLQVNDCRLIGDHNYQNLAVAYTIARFYQMDDEKILRAIAAFNPLHHRLEDLGEFHEIRYVNDSISTIGQASIQALEALQDVDVILIGGMDRGIEYDELEEYLSKREDVKVIFMYATGKRIHQEMKEKGLLREDLYETENLEEAMKLARTLCQKHHTILLSPAASSYDHFKNFEQRGAVFAQLAQA